MDADSLAEMAALASAEALAETIAVERLTLATVDSLAEACAEVDAEALWLAAVEVREAELADKRLTSDKDRSLRLAVDNETLAL